MKLLNKLKKYKRQNVIPFHMPGHKRKNFIKNELPYQIDITEIDGFDNLHNPSGILKECQDKATNLFNTKQTYFLVNGSTCGILAGIKTCCEFGDKIIMPKNCHKSVYHAVELLGLECVYINSNCDENNIVKDVLVTDIENLIKQNLDAKCVFITSPTYEGVISDIKSISEVCHKYNIPLIVDEAHGAHLFLENKSACDLGADIVINSSHKSLPSLTQTALLHVCSDRINLTEIQHNLSVFMSSSPSYVLLSSLDECVEFLINNGFKYYDKLLKNLEWFKNQCKDLKHLKILENNNQFFDLDQTKIVILTNYSNITGSQLSQLLRKYKIELEMAYTNYALAYATIFDTKNDFKKLLKALKKIDNNLTKQNKQVLKQDNSSVIVDKIYHTLKCEHEKVKFEKSLGKTCGEYVWIYPPGVPVLVPGEVITKEKFEYILYAINTGLEIKSTNNVLPNEIFVVKT